MAGATNAQMKARGHSPRFITNVRATLGKVSSLAALDRGLRALPLRRTLPTKPGTYRVALAGLRDIVANRWSEGKADHYRKVYDAGKERENEPIVVRAETKKIRDGNHRLDVAREHGAKSVLVRVLGPRE